MKRPMRIAVVDDQPANLALVRKILGPAGFEVREARSGAEAVAVVRETSPELVLLDMHLPDMHGLDVLRRIQERPHGSTPHVVAMSALASPEDQALWLQAGCVGVIEKPIDVRTFVQEISQWLPGAESKSRPAREDDQQPSRRLGETLVANMLISPEQLEMAMSAQAAGSKRLGQILVEQGALSEDDIAWALSHQLGYPYVFLRPEIVDPEAVLLLPEGFLRERRVLPILKFGHEMTLAMADPTDQHTVDEVIARTGFQVKRALALASNLDEMLERFFPGRGGAGIRGQAAPAGTAQEQYFRFHLAQALRQGATEIHFDMGGDGEARVRYRIQDVLVDRPGQPGDLHAALLQHLRHVTAAGDGPVATGVASLSDQEMDVVLFIAFLPTIHGPSATASLYPVHTDAPDLSSLGVSDDVISPVRAALHRAAGAVLVGCGDRWMRSTLLHALIPPGSSRKIWALEAVPAYRRSTINQTVMGTRADMALQMRTAAEAGADIIVVDDVSHGDALRESFETARARSVLGGHVGSDVVGILTEAIEMAGSALVASTLRAIVAARPIRLLCPSCEQPASVGESAFDGHRTFSPAGCEACGFTGFKGRRLLVDVWMVDLETRDLLRKSQVAAVIANIAKAGSRMQKEGRALVLDALTSSDELNRTLS